MHVYMIAKNFSSGISPLSTLIDLEQETETAYIGRPLSNPACPSLTYPKFAWMIERSVDHAA